LALCLSAACQSAGSSEPHVPRPASLAVSRRSSDFDTHVLRRVAILPPSGADCGAAELQALAGALHIELARAVGYEVVPLDSHDLAEIAASEPHRRGLYDPRTIITLARRFRLDALFVPMVTSWRLYPPQLFAMEFELVATETGQAIWNASIVLDGGDERTQEALHAWSVNTRESAGTSEKDSLALVSPSRFARFAAHELARAYQAR
jgi:hypothetical protein